MRNSFRLCFIEMAYKPPSNSKYAPVVDTSPTSFPFTKRAGAAPNEIKNEKVDWGAFSGKRHIVSTTATTAQSSNKPPANMNRNTLDAYISQIVSSEVPEEEKWTQSAIRKKKVDTPPEPVQKPFEEEFPTLGGPTIPKNRSMESISSTSGTLTLAERMKQKLAEENEEQLRRKLEEERKRNEENAKANDGFLVGQHLTINLSKKLRAIEDDVHKDVEDHEYNNYEHDEDDEDLHDIYYCDEDDHQDF